MPQRVTGIMRFPSKHGKPRLSFNANLAFLRNIKLWETN